MKNAGMGAAAPDNFHLSKQNKAAIIEKRPSLTTNIERRNSKLGDVKVSTGKESPGKRAAARNCDKSRKLLKLNDNNSVAVAA